MIPSRINNIVFDLGGVVIDIDPDASFSALQALADESVTVLDHFSEHSELFLDYEKGLIDDRVFRNGIRRLTQQSHLSDSAIDEAWCRMLLRVPLIRLQLLDQLKESYRIFVLSNTNAIHVRAFNRIIQSVSGKPAIDHFFEGVYYSHELQMRKPETEIYQYVLDDNNLRPEATLFLDDRSENLFAAEAVGIVTQLVTPVHGITEIFAA